VREPTRLCISKSFVHQQIQMCIPSRTEHTNVSPNCGGGLDTPSASARGHFTRQALAGIPACQTKRPPGEGRILGGEEITSLSSSSSSSPEGSNSEGVSSPRALTTARAVLLSRLLCFHACRILLSAWLASRLTESSGKVTPCGSRRMHPRPFT
jgi:hypothetical protein